MQAQQTTVEGDQDKYFLKCLKQAQDFSQKAQEKSDSAILSVAVIRIALSSVFVINIYSSKLPTLISFVFLFLLFIMNYTVYHFTMFFLSFVWSGKLLDNARQLMQFDDPKISGVLLHAIYTTPQKKHQEFVPKATELLYQLKQSDVSGFTTYQRHCLYNFVRQPRWVRRYPDLVAAAMTAVVDVGTDEGYKALQMAVNRRVSRKQDQWVQDVAQACLDRWGKG
jgi:hypothetical protein